MQGNLVALATKGAQSPYFKYFRMRRFQENIPSRPKGIGRVLLNACGDVRHFARRAARVPLRIVMVHGYLGLSAIPGGRTRVNSAPMFQ